MKIELDDTLSGRDLSKIQANFQKVENALNDNVLWRDNIEGEPNQMQDMLDMNGQRIINLSTPLSPNDAARLQDVTNAVAGIVPASVIPFIPLFGMVSTTVQTAIIEAWVRITSTIASYAASAGSSLVGWIQAGVGAVVRTVQDKLRESKSVKDFGAVGDGVVDDTAAIQAAINSFANAAYGRLVFPTGTYRTTTTLNTNNRSLILDGRGSIIKFDATMTYGIVATGVGVHFRDLELTRNPAAVMTAAIRLTGNRHRMDNVTSFNQIFPIVFLNQDVKETHYSHMRIDNDVAGKTGIIFQFDYSVNNSIHDSMLGFCSQAIYGSSTPQVPSGYLNEGLLIGNTLVVYANKAVNFDNGTFIAVSNCMFDFCEAQGMFVSNGGQNSITNTWVASNTTNGFIGVGSLAAVSDFLVTNCQFVRGAAAITGTAGVSLPGPRAGVVNNRFTSGMNGGVVTQGYASGNLFSGGGTSIVQQQGTFTPVLTFGGASVGMTYANRVGTYRRDSNGVVTYQLYLALSAKGSSVGPAVLSAMPFTLQNVTNGFNAFSARITSITGGGMLTGYMTPNTSSLTLEYASATGAIALADTNFTNTTEIVISGSYQS
jgi:hypothetical protein